jgi:predicted GTPase
MPAPELLERVAQVAAEGGDVSAASQVRAAAAAIVSRPARVIVVGAEKRGKSSLINALLRRPGLLSVASSVATSVHVTVRAADTESVTVVDYEHLERFLVPLDRLAEYTALDQDREMPHPNVREVAVGLPSDLLRAGLELVDTPGVGGLVSGHAELTLARLSPADTVLFVVNGASELTRSERDFLGRVAERVHAVIFVLTQIDKYPSWRAVRDADKALIERYVPELAAARWFEVSSLRRADALAFAADGRSADAAAQEEQSGFGPLEAALIRDVPASAAQVRARESDDLVREVLRNERARGELRRRALDGNPETAERLRAERLRLERMRADKRRPRIENELRKLEAQLRQTYTTGMGEVKRRADKLIDTADGRTPSTVAHEMQSDLEGLWETLEKKARDGTVAAAQAVARKLEVKFEKSRLESAFGPAPERGDWLPDETESDPGGRPRQRILDQVTRNFPEQVTRNFSVLSGFSVTAMAIHVLLGLTVPPAVFVSIGGGVALILYRGNQLRTDAARARGEAKRHVEEQLYLARLVLLEPVIDKVRDMVDPINDALLDLLDAKLAELDTEIAVASRSRELPDELLTAQQAEADERIAQVSDLEAQVTVLEPELPDWLRDFLRSQEVTPLSRERRDAIVLAAKKRIKDRGGFR